MIGNDIVAGAALVLGFRAMANVDALPRPKVQEFEDLAKSVDASRFPGAILAWPRPGDSTVYYAVAKNASEWRRLCPLLLAFAGPTLTDFTGRPESLDPNVPVEDYLLRGGWHIAVRLRPGNESDALQMAHRSLKRLIQTVDAATYASQAAPLPTNRLLSQLFNSLNGNDRQEAFRILEVCRNEMRVDALNLSFLEVQIHAHFGDWRSIFDMQSFGSLIWTRRPPAVTSALLEALYQVHLAPIDDGTSLGAIREEYLQAVRAYARPMLRLPPPINLFPGTWRLYALEALCAQTRDVPLEHAVLTNAEVIGQELVGALKAAQRNGQIEKFQQVFETRDSIVEAKQALAVALEVDSLATIRIALEEMQRLDVEQRKKLLESEPFRSMWRTLNAETQGVAPTDGWLGWIKKASELEFPNALSIARRGGEEWPIDPLQDSIQVGYLAQALTSFPDKPPGYDRLLDALPFIVGWVTKERDFPRSGMASVYEALLFHFVSSARRGTSILESATGLIRALLMVGVPEKAYKPLLDDAIELFGPGVGTRTIDYVLEIVEETIACPSPNPEVRQAFWYQVLARIEPMVAHLSPIQRVALNRLGEALGWDNSALRTLPDPGQSSGTFEKTILADGLRGKVIGIYSLTETAARQAESLLKALVPDIRVILSSEHVGSPMLKSMATGVDILVMVAASATHAATMFIQQHRPRGSALLYARGRGCTSILRALEGYVQNLNVS